MFHEDDGAPVNPDYWLQDVFVPTAIKAGLRPATAIEGHSEQLVGPHTLRHTYASLLINQGASVKHVARQLGHSAVQVTLDLYSHLFRETGDAEMKKLSMRIAGTAKASNIVDIATGTTG